VFLGKKLKNYFFRYKIDKIEAKIDIELKLT